MKQHIIYISTSYINQGIILQTFQIKHSSQTNKQPRHWSFML